MAYMVYQRYTTAILDAYRGHPAVPEHLEAAGRHRRWLESLAIDAAVKSVLVEQAVTLEEAFRRLLTGEAGASRP